MWGVSVGNSIKPEMVETEFCTAYLLHLSLHCVSSKIRITFYCFLLLNAILTVSNIDSTPDNFLLV